jgi:hypothetical protein
MLDRFLSDLVHNSRVDLNLETFPACRVDEQYRVEFEFFGKLIL